MRIYNTQDTTGKAVRDGNGNIIASFYTPLSASISYKGVNPTTSVSQDTTAFWTNKGPGLFFYNTLNCLNNQPSQWGYLFNCNPRNSGELIQFFFSQPSGPLYYRGANGAGWNGSASDTGTWAKIWSDKNMTYSLSSDNTTLTITTL